MKKSVRLCLISILSVMAVVLSFAIVPVYAEDISSNSADLFKYGKNGYVDMEAYDKYLDSLSEEELMKIEQEYSDSIYISGEYCSVDTEYDQEYLDSFSEEELIEIQQKVAANEQMAAQFSNELRENSNQDAPLATVEKISLPGTFTIYEQEKSYYCGAACVKSALMYINGSAPSQGDIYLRVLNEFARVPSYMNLKQDKCNYLFNRSPNKALMLTNFHYDITVEESPSFARIVVDSDGVWHYKTTGHCLLVNAIYSDKSNVQFADPSANSQTSWDAFYLMPANTVASVCKDVIY